MVTVDKFTRDGRYDNNEQEFVQKLATEATDTAAFQTHMLKLSSDVLHDVGAKNQNLFREIPDNKKWELLDLAKKISSSDDEAHASSKTGLNSYLKRMGINLDNLKADKTLDPGIAIALFQAAMIYKCEDCGYTDILSIWYTKRKKKARPVDGARWPGTVSALRDIFLASNASSVEGFHGLIDDETSTQTIFDEVVNGAVPVPAPKKTTPPANNQTTPPASGGKGWRTL